MIDDRSLRCRGDDVLAECLSFTCEFLKALLNLFDRGCGLLGELNRDAGEMTVNDGNPVAVGRDLERVGSVVVESLLVLVDPSQDLGSLPLDLLLFSSDMGDDVVQDVQRRDTGVSSTGNSLHRGTHDGLQGPKLVFQGFESDDDPGRGAVGVTDNVTLLQTQAGSLMLDDGKVRGVDKRDDEGHDRIPSIVFGVRKDDELGLTKRCLCEKPEYASVSGVSR